MSIPIIEYRIGDQFEKVFKFRNNGKPIDISGAQIIFEILNSPKNDPLKQYTCQLDVEAGDALINLSPEETKDLTKAQYLCKLKVIYPGGVIRSTDTIFLRAKRGNR